MTIRKKVKKKAANKKIKKRVVKKKTKKRIIKRKRPRPEVVAAKKKRRDARNKKVAAKKAAAKKKVGARLGGKNSQAVVLSDEQREDLRNGNSFWQLRSSHGRKPIFETPEDLLDACMQYFKACEDNPLQEEKAFAYKGYVTKRNVSKMRAMTIQGLTIFIGISDDAWNKYRKREGYVGVCKAVEKIMYNQKLTGASADLLNPSIIARHLGLKDYQDHSSEDGSMSTQPLTKKQKEMLEKVQDDEY